MLAAVWALRGGRRYGQQAAGEERVQNKRPIRAVTHCWFDLPVHVLRLAIEGTAERP